MRTDRPHSRLCGMLRRVFPRGNSIPYLACGGGPRSSYSAKGRKAACRRFRPPVFSDQNMPSKNSMVLDSGFRVTTAFFQSEV